MFCDRRLTAGCATAPFGAVTIPNLFGVPQIIRKFELEHSNRTLTSTATFFLRNVYGSTGTQCPRVIVRGP